MEMGSGSVFHWDAVSYDFEECFRIGKTGLSDELNRTKLKTLFPGVLLNIR